MKFSSLLRPTSTALDAVDEAGAGLCYFANGNLAEGYRACDVDSPVSSCCPAGYTCSSNALCVLTAPSSLEQPGLVPRTVSRGACTEARWNGKSCGGSNCLDSEDATVEADCDPVDDGGRERDCCTGGNAPGGCICLSNVAEFTLEEAKEAQTILGRRGATSLKAIASQVGTKEARLHHASKTVPQSVVATGAGSYEMFPGYHSSWARTSSSAVSILVITPVTPSTWSGAWSETMTDSLEEPSTSVITSGPETTTTSSTIPTETPITTVISIIASTLTRSSSSSSTLTPSISPSVPTVIPVFPEGASSETSSTEAATSSIATKLGLGLGIPLVVLVVALLTAFVYRRQRRLRYAQAPPFDFNGPEMAPVSAADFVPAANYRDLFPPPSRGTHQQQHEANHYGPPRVSGPWSEWGTGTAWTGTRAAAWSGEGRSLDDNQVGFVDHSMGHQGYYYNGSRDVPASPPGPSPAPGYENLGSPYEDRGQHTYQVPVVQVHQPQQQWTTTQPQPQPPLAPTRDPSRLDLDQAQGQGQGRGGSEQPSPQREDHLARVRRSRGGLSVNNEEVSPLSSTGSGMPPYPRVSAISGMGGGGWGETNPRVSRG